MSAHVRAAIGAARLFLEFPGFSRGVEKFEIRYQCKFDFWSTLHWSHTQQEANMSIFSVFAQGGIFFRLETEYILRNIHILLLCPKSLKRRHLQPNLIQIKKRVEIEDAAQTNAM